MLCRRMKCAKGNKAGMQVRGYTGVACGRFINIHVTCMDNEAGVTAHISLDVLC